MPKVIDIYNYIDGIAPFDAQAQWDNSGLLIGNGDKTIKRVLVALDSTSSLIDEAISLGCELVVTHHPIIFEPINALTESSAVLTAAQNDIAFISAHTSYDVAMGGVNDTLAKAIGLDNIEKSPSGEFTLGVCNKTDATLLAKTVKEKLGCCDVMLNTFNTEITRVAVCGGSGADFLSAAKELGADAFITGEAKHHDFIDAAQMNMVLITAGHFETEVIAMKPLFEKLRTAFPEVEFKLSSQHSPIQHL